MVLAMVFQWRLCFFWFLLCVFNDFSYTFVSISKLHWKFQHFPYPGQSFNSSLSQTGPTPSPLLIWAAASWNEYPRESQAFRLKSMKSHSKMNGFQVGHLDSVWPLTGGVLGSPPMRSYAFAKLWSQLQSNSKWHESEVYARRGECKTSRQRKVRTTFSQMLRYTPWGAFRSLC